MKYIVEFVGSDFIKVRYLVLFFLVNLVYYVYVCVCIGIEGGI